MNYSIVIYGRFAGINELISANRTNVYKGNKLKKDAELDISIQLKSQLKKLHIEKPIIIHYCYFEPNTKRDKDNISGFFHKVFQDSLVSCGIIKDDGWKEIKGYRDDFEIDKSNPRIEIVLEEC